MQEARIQVTNVDDVKKIFVVVDGISQISGKKILRAHGCGSSSLSFVVGMEFPDREDAHRSSFQQQQRQTAVQNAPQNFVQQMNGNGGEGSPAQSNVVHAGSGRRRATFAGIRARTQTEGQYSQNRSAHNLGFTNSLLQDADEDYEDFQRNFTLRTNPLDSLTGTRMEEPSSLALTSVTAPIGSNESRRSSQQQQQIQQQILQEEQQSTPVQAPSHSSSQPPSVERHAHQSEDPTIVQARNSMMARAGRHGRRTLPQPKEGKCRPPRSSTIEPTMPPPQRSRRFIDPKHKRVLDLVLGVRDSSGSSPINDDEHIVACEECQLKLVAKKSAILVQCEACHAINTASSATTTIFRSTP